MSLGGEHCICSALDNIGYSIELGGLSAKPHFVEVFGEFKALGDYGIAAAGAGEAGGFGERAYLDNAILCALDLICRVGIVDPFFQLSLGVCRAGGVIGRAEVYYIRMNAGVGQGQKVVSLGSVGIDNLSACHDVGVNIDRVNGVGDKNGVVVVEQVKYVAKIALCALGDEYLLGFDVNAESLVVAADAFTEEIVAAILAVALECLLDSHLGDRLVHSLDNGGAERQGDVADTHFYDFSLGVRARILCSARGNLGKQVAFLYFSVVGIDFHTKFSFHIFRDYSATSPSNAISAGPRMVIS